MSQFENVERYLMARMRELSQPDRPGVPHQHAFVTISRQAGAGGHSLAERLIELFGEQEDELFAGWQVYDQRLCEIVAEDPKMKTSFDSLRAEEYRTAAGDFFRQVVAPTIDQDVLIARVFEVIRAVAATGKGVIIGRGGSQVTKDLPNGVRLRLVAPESLRLDRLMELHGIDRRAARQQAKRIDQHRARLLQARFGADIDDPTNYDAIWNTGSASIDEIAHTVLALIRHRAEQHQNP
jgi:cytidylate kinase